MFAIHVASCLVDKNRANYLAKMISYLLKTFPETKIYIGFDIVGIEHQNADKIRDLITNNNQITCFTHTNGLGYSWNHPWSLHDYEVVLQLEDDWDISLLSYEKAEKVVSFMSTQKTPVLTVFTKPVGAFATILEKHDDLVHKLETKKFIEQTHFSVFSNHPHFETRSFRKLINNHPERTPPPHVERTYVNSCVALIKDFDTYSICQDYRHLGGISVNYGVSWTSFICNTDKKTDVCLVEDLQRENPNLKLVYSTGTPSIYDFLRSKTPAYTPVFFPNSYLIQTYRLKEIIPFVSLFFEQCVVVVDKNTKQSEAFINSDFSKKYYKIVEKIRDNIYLIRK